MTWGRGLGVPFGGGPLIATEQPLSEIAGEPTSFDFTDEPNGRLPGLWEAYALEHNGVGGVVWSAEPMPATYFRVAGALSLWQYTRAPALPGVGAPFTERGFAAGPSGVVEGRNLRASVVARQPLILLDDEDSDEFVYNIGLAVRLDPARPRWVGAQMRARWTSAGGWVTPLILEVLAADGSEPAIIASVVPDPVLYPRPTDIWQNQPNAELEVEVRGTDLVATISGVLTVAAQVPDDNGASQVAMFASVYDRTGPSIIPQPALVAAQFQSLRDFSKLGPPPQIPGALHLEAPSFPMLKMPVRALLDAKLIKQLRGRQFQFIQDSQVVVQHQTFFFKAGEVIRTHERLGAQEFIPATRDLFFQRTRTNARSG